MKTIEKILEKSESENRYSLYEHEVYNILNLIGILTREYAVINEKTDLKKTLKNYGPKIVMKISSPDISHKTDVGGIKFLENNPNKIKKEYRDMIKEVSEKEPKAKIEGVLITEFLKIEQELLLSMLYDEQFEHFITIGLGGTLTELYKDVAIRLAPISKGEIKEMLKELKAYPIIKGYRGKKGVNEKGLVNTIFKLNKLAEKFSPYSKSKYLITELEINPLAATDNEIIPIDGLLRFKRKERKIKRKANTKNIEKFFSPESIAVIGATEEKKPNGDDKIGKIIFQNLLKSKIGDKVYPINPKKETVLGRKCYKSVTDIPDEIDLGVVVVPAKVTPSIMKDLKKKEVTNAIIIGGGFGELGKEGKDLEKIVKEISEKGNIRLIGPNCVGTYSKDTDLKTIFLIEEKFWVPKKDPNNLALISQSGGVMITIIESLPNIGIGYCVSLGNKLDVDDSDLLQYFEKKEGTEVIGLYIEGFQDARKFYETVKKLKKPIVVIKGGKTEQGAKATISHTGAMAGDYEIAKSMFKQANIIEAETSQDFFDIVKVFDYLTQEKVKGNKIAIVSNAGGLGVLSADVATKNGLKLAEYTQKTKEKLMEYAEPYMIENVGNNPTDLGGGINDKNFIKNVETILEDKNVDAMIISPGVETQPMNEEPLVKNIINILNKSEKPVILTMADTDKYRKHMALLEDSKIPCYTTPEQGVKALATYIRYKLSLKKT